MITGEEGASFHWKLDTCVHETSTHSLQSSPPLPLWCLSFISAPVSHVWWVDGARPEAITQGRKKEVKISLQWWRKASNPVWSYSPVACRPVDSDIYSTSLSDAIGLNFPVCFPSLQSFLTSASSMGSQRLFVVQFLDTEESEKAPINTDLL